MATAFERESERCDKTRIVASALVVTVNDLPTCDIKGVHGVPAAGVNGSFYPEELAEGERRRQ
jgi:hypothetical protein